MNDGEALGNHSAPELDALRAKLAAHSPYRVVGHLLREMLPVSGGVTHTSVRRHTGAIAMRLSHRLSDESRMPPRNPTEALTLGLDTAYIRAVPANTSGHLHARVGQIEREGGSSRRFAAVQSDTLNVSDIIKVQLHQMGYGAGTALTVLTDGEDTLRDLCRAATASPITPILDWFHIAMRLQHAEQTAKGLSTRLPSHAAATAPLFKVNSNVCIGAFGMAAAVRCG